MTQKRTPVLPAPGWQGSVTYRSLLTVVMGVWNAKWRFLCVHVRVCAGMCVYVYVCVMSTSVHRGHLELVWSCLMWTLRTKLTFSGRPGIALNSWVVSLAPKGIDTRVRFNRDISSLDDTFMKSARVWPSLAVKGRHKLNFPQLFWHWPLCYIDVVCCYSLVNI